MLSRLSRRDASVRSRGGKPRSLLLAAPCFRPPSRDSTEGHLRPWGEGRIPGRLLPSCGVAGVVAPVYTDTSLSDPGAITGAAVDTSVVDVSGRADSVENETEPPGAPSPRRGLRRNFSRMRTANVAGPARDGAGAVCRCSCCDFIRRNSLEASLAPVRLSVLALQLSFSDTNEELGGNS